MSREVSAGAMAFFMALLQSLEDNFTLAIIMFIIGFIATVTLVGFVIVMHRSVHKRGNDRERETEENLR